MFEAQQEFQKIAGSSGIYKEQAQLYLKQTIPDAFSSVLWGRIVVPPIGCGSDQGPSSLTISADASCAQLDGPLQWNGKPIVDFPDVANQAGKLPYTLRLWVTADQRGKVKIDRDGNVDEAFFSKAKDASEHWRTTVPMSGGKPVSVRFPLYIIFRR